MSAVASAVATAQPTPSVRTGTVRAIGSLVIVNEDGPRIGDDEWRAGEDARERSIRSIVARLKSRGFKMARDMTRKYGQTWTGGRGDLAAIAEHNGLELRVEFWNEANVSNRNGGRYDFDKFARMPRPMQLQCAVEMAGVVRKFLWLGGDGYALGCRDRFDGRWPERDYDMSRLAYSILRIADGRTTREESPLDHFNRSWSSHRFDRDETGWPSAREYKCWSDRDRDGKPLRTGAVKYFRPRGFRANAGRLLRVQVYPGVNGQWYPVSNGVIVAHCVYANEYFDCDRPDLEPRRLVPGQRARLEVEVERATEAKQWGRLAQIARVLDRTTREATT